jgi:hypothetical protein
MVVSHAAVAESAISDAQPRHPGLPPRKPLWASPGEDAVKIAPASKGVPALITEDAVEAWPGRKPISFEATTEPVVAPEATDGVAPAQSDDDVVAGRPAKRVVPGGTNDRRGTAATRRRGRTEVTTRSVWVVGTTTLKTAAVMTTFSGALGGTTWFSVSVFPRAGTYWSAEARGTRSPGGRVQDLRSSPSLLT